MLHPTMMRTCRGGAGPSTDMSFDTSAQKTKAMRRAEPYGSALDFLMSLDRNPRRACPSLMIINLFFYNLCEIPWP